MAPRNIYFTETEEEATTPAAAALAEDRPLPRLRDVKNDPLREYAARPGKVRALPDSVAAMILCRHGKAVVNNHAILANVDGAGYREYTSKQSLVIAEMNGRGIKVNWCANRRNPDCIYLLSKNGNYLETLPLKGEPDWFSNDEVSREAIETAVGHRKRDARRLAELHAPDIAAAAERERHNAAEISKKVRQDERIVRTFPASVGGESGPDGRRPVQVPDTDETAPGRGRESFSRTETLCEVEAAVNRARTARAQGGSVDLVKETLRAPVRAKADAAAEWA